MTTSTTDDPAEATNTSRNPAAAGKSTTSGASSSGFGAPAGHMLRRAKTVSGTSPSRKRPSFPPATSSEGAYVDGFSSGGDTGGPPRRSSNFSDYSFGEARDILNPKVNGAGDMSNPESSSLASASLAFALLPALAGTFFKNGSAVVTDVMLLSLAAVFLNWSVTQPWSWYHSAQEIRVREEACAEAIIDDEDDLDSPELSKDHNTSLDDVPEEDDDGDSTQTTPKRATRQAQLSHKQHAALSELYVHEVLALLSCFLLPLVGAYLLHAIRSQLSRPSEGLVSNYNLTIFLLISELRVFSHMIKLVQSRTLHLQRVVHGNPYSSSNPEDRSQVAELRNRLDRLESRSAAEEEVVQQYVSSDSARMKQEAAVTRDVRNAIQPELDALNRAVRRYEKKATLLQYQTESRFSVLEGRLDDAIALAAVAAKTSTATQRNVFVRTLESIFTILLFPINTVLQVLMLPLNTLLAMINGNRHGAPPAARTSRSNRTGKPHGQARYGGDRIPSRVSRR